MEFCYSLRIKKGGEGFGKGNLNFNIIVKPRREVRVPDAQNAIYLPVFISLSINCSHLLIILLVYDLIFTVVQQKCILGRAQSQALQLGSSIIIVFLSSFLSKFYIRHSIPRCTFRLHALHAFYFKLPVLLIVIDNAYPHSPRLIRHYCPYYERS